MSSADYSPLSGKHVVVGVTGGIAAFKSVLLVRLLLKAGARVDVVMTKSALQFVGSATFAGLTGRPPVLDLFDPRFGGEVHVELGAADAMVLCPATMNTLSGLAHGRADDPVLATASCMRGPVVVAPAMHFRMWQRASTVRNVALLKSDGIHIVSPVDGLLASGESGLGRMAEPETIFDALCTLLACATLLTGKRILVTAGPTYEAIDPVRFLGNRSSGKMGFAVASAARDMGAKVTLIAGPTNLHAPNGVEVIRVESAEDMRSAVLSVMSEQDAIVMSAAVADYRPKDVASEKMKKTSDDMVTLSLVKNPDILAELGAKRAGEKSPVLVGFALETERLIEHARAKLERKNVDLIVANDAKGVFGSEDNEAVLVTKDAEIALPRQSKRALAFAILDVVTRFFD